MAAHTRQSTIPSEANWQQVDQLLAAVAEFSRSKLPPDEFARQGLAQIAGSLGAASARYWTIDEQNQIFALVADVRPDAADCPTFVLDDPIRKANLESVLRTKCAQWTSIAAEGAPIPAGDNWSALGSPVKLDDDCIGVIEILRETRGRPESNPWILDVLASVAELYADYFRQRQLERLSERDNWWRRLGSFAVAIHRSLDLTATAYTIANDGRPLLDCDRLSVLAPREGGCRVIAVSGAAMCDRRSEGVKLLERLAVAVAAGGSELYYDGPAERLAPQIHEPLMAYLDASGAKSLVVLPLNRAAEPEQAGSSLAGMLVVEQFTRGLDSALKERLPLVAEHSASALASALVFQQIPWPALLVRDHWRRWTRGRSRTKLGLYAAAVVSVLSWIIPAQFEIEARGELQPRIRREIFAPDDAVVEELKVDHDDRVQAGEVLAVLRNPELDLEFKRIAGERETARKRLAAVQSARVEMAVESAGHPAGTARLSGEEAGLIESLSSLERQYQLLEEQQAALSIRSPIAGRVLTWNLPQLLQSRPIQRGQVLMTVADPSGPWMLELHLADKRVGRLLDAQEGREEKLHVTYVLATDPAREHAGRIDSVAASVEPALSDEPSVLVTVAIDGSQLAHARPGAGATGRIQCGYRPIAYVWLHDLIDSVWAWIRF